MSVLFPDPADLRATARRIGHHAEVLRRRADSLVRHADQARWRSTAAGQFRSRVHDIAARMRSAADHLDNSAHSLQRHASRVEQVLGGLEHTAVGIARLVS